LKESIQIERLYENKYYINEDGSAVCGNKEQCWLISSDFTEAKEITVETDTGHGKTEAKSAQLYGVYDNKAYVAIYAPVDNRQAFDYYVVDLSTMQANKLDYTLQGNAGDTIQIVGKYYLSFTRNGNSNINSGSHYIFNIENGEVLADGMSGICTTSRSDDLLDFYRDGFYRVGLSNYDKIYKIVPPVGTTEITDELLEEQGELVFTAELYVHSFKVISDEYIAITDDVGTFLYKFDGTEVAEIVAE